MTKNTHNQKRHGKLHANVLKEGSEEARNDTLKRLRLAKGWNISELASKAGLPRPRVSKIECFKLEPSMRDMIRIASALEVDSRIIWPDRRGKRIWKKLRNEALKEKAKKKALPEEEEPIVDDDAMEKFY